MIDRIMDRYITQSDIKKGSEIVHYLDETAKSQLKDMILKHFDNLEQSIQQHTVPEGKHLVTRSYVLNSINYERTKLNELFEGK